jgi:GTPase SAR1 family protein
MAAKAVTLPDENGDFTIILNANLSDEARQMALQHEMSHIRRDHFYKEINVAFEEKEAHSEEKSIRLKLYAQNVRAL